MIERPVPPHERPLPKPKRVSPLLKFLAALNPPQEPDPTVVTEPGDKSAPPPWFAKSRIHRDLGEVGGDPDERAGDGGQS